MSRRVAAMAAAFSVLLSSALLVPTRASAQEDLWESSHLAWDAGDYVRALEGFERILQGPQAAEYLERIALVTGELYHTTELTPDGRNGRISPDGKWAAYMVSGEDGNRTALVALPEGTDRRMLDEEFAAFSPDGRKILLARVVETDELREARAALARMDTADRSAYMQQSGIVRDLEIRNTRLVVLPLGGGSEQVVAPEAMRVTQAVLGADSSSLFVVASPLEGSETTTILRYGADSRGRYGTPERIVTLESPIRGLVAPAGGRHLVYWTGGFGRGGRTPGTVTVRDLTTGTERAFEATSPSFSADGSTMAWSASDGVTDRILVAAIGGGEPREVVSGPAGRTGGFSLSPSGARLAYQQMDFFDWEIFAVSTDGSGEAVRLTREIQHDLNPVFLSEETVLAVIGEGRHRRSYLYEMATRERIRLFHNNTVRTIAPEYSWEASSDGMRILINSERDGDTVSPERGLYVVDRGRKVTVAEVLTRVRANLAVERDLRTRGEKMYEKIAADVRRVVEQVSIGRLYRYQKDLFDFDSKNITRPGNRPAAEYIHEAFRSFGYEPEYQWFERQARGASEPIRTANVLATLKGTENPELVYVVSSHFDSNARGPGADDNTSGTVVLLEAARVLAKNPQSATIVFAAFTGEESGLLGSREFVRQAVETGMHLVGALNNDMLGWSNDHRLDNTIRYSNPGIRDLQHAAAFLFSDLITYDALYYKSTDAAAYYEAYGDIVGGIGSYPVLGNPHYHQPDDVLETINHELVTETCKTTVASLMMLASSPSRLNGLQAERRGRNVRVTWESSPEIGPITYKVTWGPSSSDQPNQRDATTNSITLEGLPVGTVISVKAVNAKGIEGWDWAHVVLPR